MCVAKLNIALLFKNKINIKINQPNYILMFFLLHKVRNNKKILILQKGE